MDMNINGGNNIIAPNATKVEQHIHITIILPSDLVTVITNRIVSDLEW